MIEFERIGIDKSEITSFIDVLAYADSERSRYLAIGDTEKAAYAAISCAECMRRVGQREASISEAKLAYELFSLCGDDGGKALACWQEGTAYRHDGQYVAALQRFKTGVGAAIRSTNYAAYLHLYAGIAETLRITKMYDVSLVQHDDLQSRFEAEEDSRGVVWALQGRAQILRQIGRLQESMQLFEISLNRALAIRDRRSIAFSRKGCAGTAFLLGQTGRAEREILIAIEMFRDLGYDIGLGFSQLMYGQLLDFRGDDDAAISMFGAAKSAFAAARYRRGLTLSEQTVSGRRSAG